ncbi:MAG: hypothetical protein AAF383_25840 [Cyanobacteria bacterium P01_A01_bin.83]
MFNFNPKAQSLLGAVFAASLSAITLQSSARAEIKNISEFLFQTAEMMNQNLPKMINQNTRWDSSVAGPGKMLSHKFTLVNYSANQIDGVELAKDMRDPIIKTICNNPAAQVFSENGVFWNINYYDNASNLIARVQVAPKDCK